MKKKSGKLMITLILIALLAVAGAAFLIFYSNYAVLDGKIYPLSVTEVDLKNSGINDLSVLNRFSKLEKATVSGGKVKKLGALKGCPSLRSVIISGSNIAASQCIDFYELHPDAELVCDVVVSDRAYSSRAKEMEVPASANNEELKQYAAFRHLENLDLSGCSLSDDVLEYLQSRLPQCIIKSKLSFNGKDYLTTDETVTLPSDFFDGNVEESVKILKHFYHLNIIDATACNDNDALYDLQQLLPESCVKWNISLFDMKTATDAESLNFDKQERSLEEYQSEFTEKLKYFHRLKTVSMCRCGLGNDEMGTIVEQFPDVKFIWYVRVGRWCVRSDATSFSTLIADKADGRRWNEDNFAPLFKYCTDLVSLDMGHCRIKDISGIANLKKLRGLILTDNFVEDLTPLSELKDLEFIEMNTNNAKSVEPLKDLKKLQMLNLCGSLNLTDLSPLYHHDNLKIVIFDRLLPKEEQKRFAESNPGCDSYFIKGQNTISTNAAWKASPMREKFKNSFRKWNFVVGFDEEADEFIYDWSDRFRMGFKL